MLDKKKLAPIQNQNGVAIKNHTDFAAKLWNLPGKPNDD